MSEHRDEESAEDFWSWRSTMYRFVHLLSPEDVEAITAFAQMEMLEAGFAAVGEFHYLHHQPDGTAYVDPAEMSRRIILAAKQTGIGLTFLPVYYERGGCDNRPLAGSQLRFRNDLPSFSALLEGSETAMRELPPDCCMGIAPHSLRAVGADALAELALIRPGAPIHIHAAEQIGEVEEVLSAYGARPVEWLLANQDVNKNWCLIHCTHMTGEETAALAGSGAVAGLCPITEANLGDGICNAAGFLRAGGRFALGTDSNVQISSVGEMRQLEYSQRLGRRQRAVLATSDESCGRLLWERSARGAAQALGRPGGAIEPGRLADLVAIDAEAAALAGCREDHILDALAFASAYLPVTDLWTAGRHVVSGGSHMRHDAISAAYRKAIVALRGRIAA